jgi:hypothetical protein
MSLSRITSASIANSAISAADIADGTITAAKIISVANTQITGNIVSSQIAPNQTLNGNVSVTGTLAVSGATSGAITIAAPAVAGSGTLTLPVATDTLIGKATTDVLTNKSIAATQLTGTIAAARLPAGSVLQVVNATYATATSTTSTSFVTTGLSAAITPISASNKVLVTFTNYLSTPATNVATIATVFRGTAAGTNLGDSAFGFGAAQSPAGANVRSVVSGGYLDSPATTSSQTYTVAFRVESGTGIAQTSNAKATLTLMEIAG